MACCMGAKYGNWCKDEKIVWEDPVTKDKYCLFHAPAEHKNILSTKFNDKIRKRIHKQTRKETIDLRGTIFPDEVKFSKKNMSTFPMSSEKYPKINLSFSKFKGDLFILDMDFQEELDISNCNFAGRTIIMGTFFRKKLLLDEAVFNNKITISNCNFSNAFTPKNLFVNNKSLSILDTTFEHSVIIKFATNPSILRLILTSCRDIAVITENITSPIQTVRLKFQKFSLETVISLQGIFFKKLVLPKTLRFPIFFSKCLIAYFSSGIYHFQNNLTFSSCKFQEIYLTTHNIEDINFCGCSFPRADDHRIITSDAFPYVKVTPTPSTKRPKKTFHYLEDLYRKLKQTAQSKESGMESSDWHYWEKFFAQQRLLNNDDHTNHYILKGYHILSGYGESVKRASICFFLFLICTIPLSFVRDSTQFYYYHASLIKSKEIVFKSAQGTDWKYSYLTFPNGALKYFNLKSSLDFIPLATRTPESKSVSLWRIIEVGWQFLITFQATLLGFALRNRYRR